MSDDAADGRTLHAHCALCGTAICWGDRTVTIGRWEEMVRDDGEIQVMSDDVLIYLCWACGTKHPASAVRLSLGGRTFSGTDGRGY